MSSQPRRAAPPAHSAGVHAGRLLLRGGSVYAPSMPGATALLVVDGEIAWVGEEEGARSHLDIADDVVQLEGRLVTPGFVDAHVHLAQTGFALQSLDLAPAPTLTDALSRLEAFAETISVGSVLFAHGWDETHWPEGRAPRRDEVDRAVGGAVAYVARVDSHSAVVSSALIALRPEITGIDGWTSDGRVERDAHHAAREVTHGLRSEADRAAAIRRALRHAASRGITSVHEVNAPHISPFSDFATIRALQATDPLPEVVPYWGALFDGSSPQDFLFGYAGDLTVDGAIGSRTAALQGPYCDANTSGHLYLDRDQVRDHVVACTQAGKQAGFHVIGDRAMHEVMAGFRSAAEIVGAPSLVAGRHRLEHAEMLDAEAIAVLAALGIVASVQPAFDAAWGAPGQLYELRLGSERAAPMNPFASLRAAGVGLAFGSDSPVTPLDPWGGVRAAVFLHEESERLSVRDAFAAHTRGGHHARRCDTGGLLTSGAPATYAVWDTGSAVGSGSAPTPAGELPDLHPDDALPCCVQSVVRGRPVFTAEPMSVAKGAR